MYYDFIMWLNERCVRMALNFSLTNIESRTIHSSSERHGRLPFVLLEIPSVPSNDHLSTGTYVDK
jgi:hypothetical protein